MSNNTLTSHFEAHPHDNIEASSSSDLADTTEPRQPTTKELVVESLRNLEESLTHIQSVADLEMVAFDVMDSLPESIEISQQIAKARSSGNNLKEASLVERQKRIYADVCSELALIAGVETDEELIARQNDEYRDKLADKIGEASMAEVDSGEILVRMGMLTSDSDTGELKFSYPIGSFPPHIDDKWNHYLELVSQHIAAITQRNEGISNDVVLISQLDAVRKAAHNNLSLAIKDFLQMETWDLEKCRRLVIKMRDARFPTIETAEKEVTAQEVLRLIQTVRALREK